MNHLNPNLIAKIYYLTSQEGGRKSPCTHGYRPQFSIPEIEMQSSASQQFEESEWVVPGDTVTANITLLSPQLFKGLLKVGKHFELREGSKTVARGEILKILSLEAHNHNKP